MPPRTDRIAIELRALVRRDGVVHAAGVRPRHGFADDDRLGDRLEPEIDDGDVMAGSDDKPRGARKDSAGDSERAEQAHGARSRSEDGGVIAAIVRTAPEPNGASVPEPNRGSGTSAASDQDEDADDRRADEDQNQELVLRFMVAIVRRVLGPRLPESRGSTRHPIDR